MMLTAVALLLGSSCARIVPQPPSTSACTAGEPVAFAASPSGILEASPEQVHARACGLRVIDVREDDELTGSLGVIAGAEHLPMRRLVGEATSWPRDTPLVLVCRSGRRSGALAEELTAMGFTQVASMTGGMLAWRDRGLPIASAPAVAAAVSPESVMREVSRDDVIEHVGSRDHVRWTKAATLMLHGTQACIDGRDAHAIVGTPGGDAGELVLALAAGERIGGHAFATADVERIVDDYLEAFGQFYMHSDELAVAALVDRLAHVDPTLAPPTDRPPDLARFIAAPPPEARDALLALVTEPELVGCGHLRLMLQHPDAYGVRRAMVADVVRAFYRRLWAGHRDLELVVLAGGHDESAVVTVELPSEVHAYTRIPLLLPRVRDTEVFVAHPQVARFVRRENAAFLLERVPALRADETAYFADLEQLAAQQLDETMTRLAAGLPRYRVSFSGNTFEVTGPD